MSEKAYYAHRAEVFEAGGVVFLRFWQSIPNQNDQGELVESSDTVASVILSDELARKLANGIIKQLTDNTQADEH